MNSSSLRNKRYRDAHNLKPFSVRVDGVLIEQLNNKLKENNKTKKSFLEDAIKKYLNL